MKNKLTKILLIVIVLLIALLISKTFILDRMVDYLIIQDKLEPADIIIVLSGDSKGERVMEGIRLYKQGFAPKMVMTGGPLAWNLTSAQWMKRQAIYFGIPANSILIEDRSCSTLENAKFSKILLDKLKVKKVIVVTAPTHTRRAYNVFKNVLGKNTRLIIWPESFSEFKRNKWWTRHEDTQLVMWEYVSLVYYRLLGY